MRDGNPANHQNWKLVCSACGAEFANDETIDLLGGHFVTEHPDLDTPHLNTIWVGKGPAPRQAKTPRNGPRGRRRR